MAKKKRLHLLIYPSTEDWLAQIKLPLRVFLLENENDHFNLYLVEAENAWVKVLPAQPTVILELLECTPKNDILFKKDM